MPIARRFLYLILRQRTVRYFDARTEQPRGTTSLLAACEIIAKLGAFRIRPLASERKKR